jgi:hypothetical protein
MKAKPQRKTLSAKEVVIQEAIKYEVVTMTFKVPEKLQKAYKIKCLQNSQTMTDVFIEHIKQYTDN